MKLVLKRKAKRDTYTIGNLYIDGELFCNTIEDKDRGLSSTDSTDKILKIKVAGQTAIPSGTYTIDMNTVSPKYSQQSFYKSLCRGGKVPRLLDVPGFEGVLIHCGNTADDSAGCIIVGENNIVGRVNNSRITFSKLYARLLSAYANKESITIQII